MNVSASEQVQLWLQGLRPDAKHRVRQQRRTLASGRHRGLDLQPLRGELEGFYRLRIGDYRIVYHLDPGPIIRLDYADLREVVYDLFRQLRALREP